MSLEKSKASNEMSLEKNGESDEKNVKKNEETNGENRYVKNSIDYSSNECSHVESDDGNKSLIDFEENEHYIEWINPMHSVNYARSIS